MHPRDRGKNHISICNIRARRCYVYMDGEAHVRASVAMDLITTALVSAAKVVPCRRSTPHALSRESSRTDPRDGPGAHRVRACFARDQRARVSL